MFASRKNLLARARKEFASARAQEESASARAQKEFASARAQKKFSSICAQKEFASACAQKKPEVNIESFKQIDRVDLIAREAARRAGVTGMSTDAFAIMRHLCVNFICISLRNTREQCDLRDYHEQQSIPLSTMIEHSALHLTGISSADSHAHCQDCISDSSESSASHD